jgi:hypothetical protein
MVLVAVVCLGVLAAFFFYVSGAIREFLALRKEARSLLTLHWGERADASPASAVDHYQKVGDQLFAFDRSKRIAALLIRLLGYRPRDAGIALMSVASTWSGKPAGSPDDEYHIIQCTLYPQHRRFRRWRSFFEELSF